MQLKVLGSGSKGNCYLLLTGTSVIVIDCGVPLIELKKQIGFDISLISGVMLTHAHGDHCKYVRQYLEAGLSVYAHKDTIEQTKIKSHKWKPIDIKKIIQVGEFRIMPFDLKHDITCLGFIFSRDGNTFCFLTDTLYCPYTFDNLTNIIIECNFSEEILISRQGMHHALKNRVMRSHTSLETCIKFLKANDLSKVNNIILVHLSDGNSNARQFKEKIEQQTGKTVHIADSGMSIDFGAKPF